MRLTMMATATTTTTTTMMWTVIIIITLAPFLCNHPTSILDIAPKQNNDVFVCLFCLCPFLSFRFHFLALSLSPHYAALLLILVHPKAQQTNKKKGFLSHTHRIQRLFIEPPRINP
jgi:hypothetical protein